MVLDVCLLVGLVCYLINYLLICLIVCEFVYVFIFLLISSFVFTCVCLMCPDCFYDCSTLRRCWAKSRTQRPTSKASCCRWRVPASAQQQQFGLYFCLFLHYTRSDNICKKRSGDKQNHSGMMLHKTRHQNRRALWWPEVFGKSLMGDLWHALGHPGESWGALGRLGGVPRRPWGALGVPWGNLIS